MAIWETFTNQKQWERYLKQLLKDNDVALFRAIVLIYKNQTDEEQVKGQSIDNNYIGFTKWDAKDLTAIALKLIKKQQLTDGEIARARNKIGKYWRQLMVISKNNIRDRELEQSRQELSEQATLSQQLQVQNAEREAILSMCANDGVPCAFGICDECALTMRS